MSWLTEIAALRQAKRAIRNGSKSFAMAAQLFDPGTREDALLLYAWCRHCDDAIDGQVLGLGEATLSRIDGAACLAELEVRTRAALDGRDPGPSVFAGLASVMRRHEIPEHYAFDHLAGFRMDVEGRSYDRLADTVDYAYHVAGVVGLMMGYLMGVRDAATLERACDLGIAFQLTNMARDLVDDAESDRLYLPADWLADEGLTPGTVAAPANRAALARLASRLVAAAEPHYASAAIGIRSLPPRSAWAVASALGIYRDIGLAVVARGVRAWDSRVSTSTLRKLRHVAGGAVIGLRTALPGVRRAAPRGQLTERTP